MNLRELRLLFLDTQTTGMRPPKGEIIDLGFFVATADEPARAIEQRFSLESGRGLAAKISEITGLTESDLIGKPAARNWLRESFLPMLENLGPVHGAAVHCAAFETAFLAEHRVLPASVFCTQILVKKLFPNLPSRNIRAVAGYFGFPIHGPNRAATFALATHAIWKGLIPQLEHHGVSDLQTLQQFISAKEIRRKSARPKPFSYRITGRKRLNLPDSPGIYKMLAKDGSILYVGKATSLKERVNSYFRGVKNRDRRKLEMIAQVWDLDVEACESPLEAALREADEIKKLDPPYNVALRRKDRELRFYSRDFLTAGSVQSSEHPIGPFRPDNWIELILKLHRSINGSEFEQIFFEPIDSELLSGGWSLAAHENAIPQKYTRTVRGLLTYGLQLYRRDGDPEPGQDTEVTVESVARKFIRLLTRGGGELVKARRLTRALNTEVEFLGPRGKRRLRFQHGEWNFETQPIFVKKKHPWQGLNIDTYDRMSVLLSELSRVEHHILRHRPQQDWDGT